MQDQRHRQRDDGKIHRADPAVEREVAEQCREPSGASDTRYERQRRAARVDAHDPVDVAAHAEERRLSKRKDPAKAPDQVEAQREQTVDHEHSELDDLEGREHGRQRRNHDDRDGPRRPRRH